MTLVKCRPNRNHFLVQDQFDKIFENFFHDNFVTDSTSFNPPVDMVENDENYLFTVELPGLSKDDVHMSIKDSMMTISGNKKNRYESENDSMHRIESSFGSFSRSFRLPKSIDRENVKANFESGVLSISMPKVEEAKPTEIEIEAN